MTALIWCALLAGLVVAAREAWLRWQHQQLIAACEEFERDFPGRCGLCGFDRWRWRHGGPKPTGRCPRCDHNWDAGPVP